MAKLHHHTYVKKLNVEKHLIDLVWLIVKRISRTAEIFLHHITHGCFIMHPSPLVGLPRGCTFPFTTFIYLIGSGKYISQYSCGSRGKTWCSLLFPGIKLKSLGLTVSALHTEPNYHPYPGFLLLLPPHSECPGHMTHQSYMHARQTLCQLSQPSVLQKKQLIYVSNYQYNHSPESISVTVHEYPTCCVGNRGEIHDCSQADAGNFNFYFTQNSNTK